MLIINADDLGRDRKCTDEALACFRAGAVTSASVMVFMADSHRAAQRAAQAGLDTGLHLNLTLPLNDSGIPPQIRDRQLAVARFLGRGKWPQVVYNPLLTASFVDTYRAQVEEYRRLFGKEPTQIDGHSHMHLCLNMVLGRIIPPGSRIRRTFTFSRREKSLWNRLYRHWLDRQVLRRYKTTAAFFSIEPLSDLSRVGRIVNSALTSDVELMVHPAYPGQRAFLTSSAFLDLIRDIPKGSYGTLP